MVLAQEDTVDSVELQKRIDEEVEAFRKWKDSVASARGTIRPGEQKNEDNYPGSELPTAEQLQENEQRLSQLKRIIIWLFILVMTVGVILSKPWKKKQHNNTTNSQHG